MSSKQIIDPKFDMKSIQTITKNLQTKGIQLLESILMNCFHHLSLAWLVKLNFLESCIGGIFKRTK